MTALLLHGPAAQDALMEIPAERGWLTPVQPFGLGETLKVDAARELVAAVVSPPPTNRLCAYMASIQGASDRVQDVLLKVLEDHDPRRVTIILATNDIGTVLPTVRSRCHERWCGSPDGVPVPALLGVAQGMLADLRGGRMAEAIDPLRKKAHDPTELLDALSYAAKNDHAQWAKLRPLHGYNNLSIADLLAALL